MSLGGAHVNLQGTTLNEADHGGGGGAVLVICGQPSRNNTVATAFPARYPVPGEPLFFVMMVSPSSS